MVKIRRRNGQTAQGMVEFALVLPILLLIILGIIAFGHLFFVYSSVVAASREAARWGSAVGVSASSAPRYQDCTSIRASAVRIGEYAGVRPETIAIDFDHGPVSPPTAPVVFSNCPLGGTGPGAADVNRGDRIIVSVTVNYQPIVPLVNLPSFPLTATTARTIIKSLPVGDAPVAEDPCSTKTTLTITPVPVSPAKVGQPVVFSAKVTADDGTTPTGAVSYSDSDGEAFGPFVLNKGAYTFSSIAYKTAGKKTISFRYDSDNVCHNNTAITDYEYIVEPAVTTLVIDDPNDPSGLGTNVYFTVRLLVTSPGAATSAGPAGSKIKVTMGLGSCEATLDSTLAGTCYMRPTQLGVLTVTARFNETANYLGSYDEESHQVVNPQTATFYPTPIQPTSTPEAPNYCAVASDLNFSTSQAIDFKITTPDISGAAADLTAVDLEWPSMPAANWIEVRFGAQPDPGSCNLTSATGEPNCVWKSALASGIAPPTQTVSNSDSGPQQWNGVGVGLGQNSTKYMRLVFDHSLASQQHYTIIAHFSNGCKVPIQGDKTD